MVSCIAISIGDFLGNHDYLVFFAYFVFVFLINSNKWHLGLLRWFASYGCAQRLINASAPLAGHHHIGQVCPSVARGACGGVNRGRPHDLETGGKGYSSGCPSLKLRPTGLIIWNRPLSSLFFHNSSKNSLAIEGQ